MEESRILCAEMLLAKYFAERESENDAVDIINWVRAHMKGSGVKRVEIKEARKRIGIGSRKTEKGYLWTWEGKESPEQVWKQKSEEFGKC